MPAEFISAIDGLFESSLSRILSHWNNREFVIISADRVSNSPSTNTSAREDLEKSLKALGLGYVPVEGVGQEEDETGAIQPTLENAYLVPDNNTENFLPKILELAVKFNQWGICHARGDGSGALLTSDGKVSSEFASFHAGVAKFFTRLYQSKKAPKKPGNFPRTRTNTFHLESIRKAPKAQGVLEQQGRYLRGEILSHL